ncbi:MAG TPA: ATP synthase F1 subunit delta [Chloroflexota bacterium]
MATIGVARRYARAVFEIAQEEHDLAGWERDLHTIADVLKDPRLSAYLASPAVPTEEKLRLVETTLGGLSEKRRSLVSLLIENGRTSNLGQIVDAFDTLLNEARGIVHARVTTAVPLSDSEVADVAEHLKGVVHRDVILSTAVDPSIIGGFVARIGDRLIDASVIGRLNALRESLIA